MPASTYGLETVALTEQQQRRLPVCENNWRIADQCREIGKKDVTMPNDLVCNLMNPRYVTCIQEWSGRGISGACSGVLIIW